jgi:hypothetical protein
LSITLSVKSLPSGIELHPRLHRRIFIAGLLLLDAEGVRLYDWDTDQSVPLCDPEAYAAIRAAVPSGQYLGGMLLHVFVRSGKTGPELHSVYWAQFYEPEETPTKRWGVRIQVRPEPPEHAFR